MSLSVPGYFNGTVPERATAVTVNQVVLTAEGYVNERYVGVYGVDFVNLSALVLPYTPVSGYPVDLYLNGQLLIPGTDYTVTGDSIAFIGDHLTTIVNGDKVLVAYVRES